MYSKKRNVTYIDQLPDLEDLERNTNIPTGKITMKYNLVY